MIALYIILGLLPSFIWLSFFLQEDIHPEPKKMIFRVFIGGIIAAAIAAVIQIKLKPFFPIQDTYKQGLFYFFLFAAIEEILKFVVTYLIVHKSKFFDEPIDAMIYMITAATGMAAVENVALMMNNQIMDEKIGLLVFRFLGATILHIFASALIGFFWGKAWRKNFFISGIFILVGLAFAIILHTGFNYSIALTNGAVIYPSIMIGITSFFIFYTFENLKKDDILAGSMKYES